MSCLAAAPLRAQEPPRFLIESIVVEGVSRAAGRQIVADESLLKPGQTYTEPQLRQAVYRIKRLPFVVDAEFSLRKGSERGAYGLVVKVEEATPVFFLAEADAQRGLSTDSFTGKRRTVTLWQRFGTLGSRMFVGSHGLAYGSVEKVQHQDGELVQAGYTQYDLFGAGSFAGVEANSAEGFRGVSQYQVGLFGGVPLTSAQSLRVDLEWDRSKGVFEEQLNQNEQRLASLDWIYNTTDDPLFPMSGTSASVSATYGWIDERSRSGGSDPGFDFSLHPRFVSIGGGGTYHQPLTARQSLELGGSFNWETFAYRERIPGSTSLRGQVVLGHSVNLWGYERTQRFGDLRWENLVVANYYDLNGVLGGPPAKSVDLTSSLGYRSRWGVLRLSFTYFGVWTSY
ncbi:MAG TPA: hypothetical protein VH988_34180 [Thermoanaerobaculia bacterium]|nr:hypothetical protein [Thermoanaerobaculia bacterium]